MLATGAHELSVVASKELQNSERIKLGPKFTAQEPDRIRKLQPLSWNKTMLHLANLAFPKNKFSLVLWEAEIKAD